MLKSKNFKSETSVLICESDGSASLFEDVTKIVIRKSKVYVHRSHFIEDCDDAIVFENVTEIIERD